MSEKYFYGEDKQKQDRIYMQSLIECIGVLENGSFKGIQAGDVFTMTPGLLIDKIQDHAMQKLFRGTIELGEPIDREYVRKLHTNFADYLRSMSRSGLASELQNCNNYQPSSETKLKKPFIYYERTYNLQDVYQLDPILYVPDSLSIPANIFRATQSAKTATSQIPNQWPNTFILAAGERIMRTPEFIIMQNPQGGVVVTKQLGLSIGELMIELTTDMSPEQFRQEIFKCGLVISEQY
jgi:hypothetical protein